MGERQALTFLPACGIVFSPTGLPHPALMYMPGLIENILCHVRLMSLGGLLFSEVIQGES